MALQRMRTINEAIDYIKANDPDTRLTKTALRRMVTSGELHAVQAGQKYLISLEVLEAHLAGETDAVAAAPDKSGEIRRVTP